MNSLSYSITEREKNEMKRAINSKLTEDSIWEPISIEWFDKWRKYVDYDNNSPDSRSKEEIEKLHPGKIDNTKLKGTFGDELSRNVIEGKDFILIPETTAKFFFHRYEGGPRFARTCLNIGTSEQPILQIKLYPLRIEVYVCNRKSPINEIWDKTIYLHNPSIKPNIKYYRNAKTFHDLRLRLKELVLGYNTYRLWYYDSSAYLNNSASSIQTLDLSSDGSTNSSNNLSTNLIDKSLFLTSDKVNKYKNWKLVTNFNVDIEEIKDNVNYCLEIIVEESSIYNANVPMSSLSIYPRDPILNKWKSQLVVGNRIDCLNKSNNWLEAVVVEVNTISKVFTVHFLGYPNDKNESIPFNHADRKFEALYTKTKNWRKALEEDEEVDVLISKKAVIKSLSEEDSQEIITTTDLDEERNEEDDEIWVIGKVEEIDFVNDKLKVSFNISEIISEKKELSDDDKKILFSSNSNNRNSDTTNEIAKRFDKWVDLYGEEICQLFTHTDHPLIKNHITSSPIFTSNHLTNYTSNYQSNYSSNYQSNYSPSNQSNYQLTYQSNYGMNDDSEEIESHTIGTPIAPGCVGLRNLGNTCFMNSILQCLSHITKLTEYFITNNYKKHINNSNPLGHNGKLANVFSKLLKNIYSNQYSVVVPRNFKKVVGNIFPQFNNYDQHDSQEFMGFIIDGLHEDCNTVLNKPIVNDSLDMKIYKKFKSDHNVDNDAIMNEITHNDSVISVIAWNKFLYRNQSYLVDLLYGQTKSHVTCVQCKKESKVFEAFNCLSLPIPVKQTKRFNIVASLLPIGSDYIKLSIDVEVTDNLTCEVFKSLIIRELIRLGYLSTYFSKADNDMNDNVHIVSDAESKTDDESFDLIEQDGYISVSINNKIDNKHVNNIDNDIELTTTYLSSKNLYFQLCIMNSMTCRLGNTFNDSEIMSLKHTSNIDTFVLIQLTHDLSNYSSNNSNIYSSNYISTYTTTNLSTDLSANPSVGLPNYLPVDILIGSTFQTMYSSTYQSLYHSSNNIHVNLFNFPQRIVINTKTTKCIDLHQICYNFCYIRYLNHLNDMIDTWKEYYTTCHSLEKPTFKLPYTVYISDRYGSNTQTPLPFNENLISSINFTTNHTLMIVFTNEIKNDPMIINQNKVFINGHSNNANNLSMHQSNNQPTNPITLMDCFNSFSIKEKLPETETIYCSTCKEHLAPYKKMDIYSAPDILIIHLKRFLYSQTMHFVHREKITELVAFPIKGLDLTNIVKGPINPESPPIYDLFAVSNHSGSLLGGHYTAFCYNEQTRKWYEFNDSFVSEASEDRIVSPLAYVLFYKRREGTSKWGDVKPITIDFNS